MLHLATITVFFTIASIVFWVASWRQQSGTFFRRGMFGVGLFWASSATIFLLLTLNEIDRQDAVRVLLFLIALFVVWGAFTLLWAAFTFVKYRRP